MTLNIIFSLAILIFLNVGPPIRVDTPITDHLKYYASYLKKYKVVQFLPVSEDRYQEDNKFFDNFIS